MAERPLTSNVLKIWDLATEGERTYGGAWYEIAHRAANRIAEKYGQTTATVAAVISALSPSNTWHRNLVDAENFVKDSVDGRPYADVPSASTYPVGKRKAWDLLHGLYDNPIDAFLTGTAEKTKAFFLSIASPYTTHDVVVDGHSWNIATNRQRPLADVPSITRKRYKACSRAYVRAAAKVGVTPQTMQATCWIVWRRLTDWQLTFDDMLLTTERL